MLAMVYRTYHYRVMQHILSGQSIHTPMHSCHFAKYNQETRKALINPSILYALIDLASSLI